MMVNKWIAKGPTATKNKKKLLREYHKLSKKILLTISTVYGDWFMKGLKSKEQLSSSSVKLNS